MGFHDLFSSGGVNVRAIASGTFINTETNGTAAAYPAFNHEYHAAVFVGSIGNDGTIYLIGVTESRDLPVTSDAMQSRLRGDWDAFICEFDSDLEELGFLTYFGGERRDWTTFGMVVDEDED